jgi:hypothetical protein
MYTLGVYLLSRAIVGLRVCFTCQMFNKRMALLCCVFCLSQYIYTAYRPHAVE